MSDETKLAYEFTCPNGHTQIYAYDRAELKATIDKPYGHDIQCPCGAKFLPPDWPTRAREALGLPTG